MNRLVDLFQKNGHGLRPLLTILLKGPFKLPQVMGIAQSVRTVVTVVWLPVVMTENALIRR